MIALASTWTVESLAAHFLRRVPGPERLFPAVCQLAQALFELAADPRIPSDAHLILGGSFARGEPCIRLDGCKPLILSDFDFLISYRGVLPPITEEAFLAVARERLPRPTTFVLREEQYARLGTPVFLDAKLDAICLNQPSLPSHVVPVMDERDAFELGVYCVIECFGRGLIRRCHMGEGGTDFEYFVNRIALNALRSAGMLEGAYYYHDVDRVDGRVASGLRHELQWRDGLVEHLPNPARRLLSTIRLMLRRHREKGRYSRHADSVAETAYGGKVGAQYVAFQQHLALELIERLLQRVDEATAESAELLAVQQEAWQELLQSRLDLVPAPTPEQFFWDRRPAFLDQLLQMKL